MEQTLLDVETTLSVTDAAGCTVTDYSVKGMLHRFSHDRYRVRSTNSFFSFHSLHQMAAHGMASATEQATTILRVADHLRGPNLRDEYLLVAADLALNAKERGHPGSLVAFMELMIAAGERAAQHASFEAAKRFLDGYESEHRSVACDPHGTERQASSTTQAGSKSFLKSNAQAILITYSCCRKCMVS